MDCAEVTARLAHQLWEQLGKPKDRDLEIWLKAEAEVSRQVEALVLVINLIHMCEMIGVEFPCPHRYGSREAAIRMVNEAVRLGLVGCHS